MRVPLPLPPSSPPLLSSRSFFSSSPPTALVPAHKSDSEMNNNTFQESIRTSNSLASLPSSAHQFDQILFISLIVPLIVSRLDRAENNRRQLRSAKLYQSKCCTLFTYHLPAQIWFECNFMCPPDRAAHGHSAVTHLPTTTSATELTITNHLH